MIKDAIRFWDKVTKTDSCWNWTGSTNGVGYGELRVDGKKLYAHRISYEMHKGEIAEGNQVDHVCRNRSCVNPSHLDEVTPTENIRRAIPYRKDTTRSHCFKGHDLTDSYVRHDKKGRNCRQCNLQRVKEYQARKRQQA